MIAFLLAVAAQAAIPAAPAAPATDAVPLGAIGTQALPARGCAAFLWTVNGERTLVAMAAADPAAITLAIDGKTNIYARTDESGVGGFGFGQVSTYRTGDVSATLDMTITTRGELTAGAIVAPATLRIERPGKDIVVLPVGGLIGCRA